MKNKQTLISFIGGSDPTRDDFDGPMLHIVRHYQPEKVILLYSESFFKDTKRRDVVLKHLNYLSDQLKITFKVEEHEIKSELKVNNYDIIEDVYKSLNKVIPKNNDSEILVNITSGTSQLTAGILIYSKFNINYKNLKLLQVTTPRKALNESKPALELNPKNNLDYEENSVKRVQEVDFELFFTALNKNILIDLIKSYQYDKVISLLTMINYQNDEVFNLLNLLIDYIDLSKEIKQNHYNVTHYDLETYHFIRYFNVVNIKYLTEDYRNFFIMASVLLFELTYKNVEGKYDFIEREHNRRVVDKSSFRWKTMYQTELNGHLDHEDIKTEIKDLIIELSSKNISDIRNDYAHNFIVKMDLSKTEITKILNKLKALLVLTIGDIEKEDFNIIENYNKEIIKKINNE